MKLTEQRQHIDHLAEFMLKQMALDNFGYVYLPFMKRTEKYLPELEKALGVFLEALGRPIEFDDIQHIVAGEHTYVQETYGPVAGFKELNAVLGKAFTEEGYM